jgi:hypothetical protein
MNRGVGKILHLILDETILKINEVSLAITAALFGYNYLSGGRGGRIIGRRDLCGFV